MNERALLACPGGDLVVQGLADLRMGVDSIEALLVRVGATNLRLRGLDVPSGPAGEVPEHRLFTRLEEGHGRAGHSRYNALIRRLVSFERSLPCVPR